MAKRLKHRMFRADYSREAAAAAGTELLVMDQGPFLKKALSLCKRLRKELDKKQALLTAFEEVDRAAYERWLFSSYGTKLTEVRELQEELSAYQFILHHLSQCVYRAIEEVPKLYQELFRLKKKGALYTYVPPEPEETGEAEADDEPFGHDEGAWDEDYDDDLRAYFDDMFGAGHSGGDWAQDDVSGVNARKSADEIRLKACYRKLAKRLHPDHSELEGPVREKRWHEIQAAYQNQDLEGLLRVEAVCDMDEEGLSVKLGLARLRDLAAYHKSHLIPIRNALRTAKKDVAFGFAECGPTAALEREIAGDLKYNQISLKTAIADLDRSAKLIRNEVEEHLREAAIAAARAACDEREKMSSSGAGESRSCATRRKQTRKSQSSDDGMEQMSFF
jgi:hypothetical protein